MNKTKIENRIIHCSKINIGVTIQLTYTIIDADQSSYIGKKLTEFDCLKKMECPIAKHLSNAEISFNWNSCPIHKEFSKK